MAGTQALLIASAGLCLFSPAGRAQVSEPTEADKAKIPLQFRPEDQKHGAVTSFDPRGTPAGYRPDANPREFTGSYVSGNSGGPGGPGPPGNGPPPVDGAAPAGAPAQRKPTCIPSFDYGAYAIHVVSSPGRLTVVGEENHRIRRIYIGARLPAQPTPAYAGNSVGRWDGNTLVIDTVAIKGHDGLRQRERWTRRQDGSIEIRSGALDANGRLGPESISTLEWRPDISYVENICEDFGEAFGSGYGSGGK